VVPHRLLAEVTGGEEGEEQMLAAVEAALAARLLAEEGPDGYRFPHDLIRETVEDGLSAARRRRLHRRIGQALEAGPGASAESLAFHFGRSGEDGKAIRYLKLAGEQAQQRVAHAAAAEFYAAAAARLEEAGRAAEVVPVTEKQGVALYRAGRYDAAITVLDRVLAGYQAAGDGEGMARVTGRLAAAHYRAGTRTDALGPLISLASADPALAAAAVSPGAIARWHGLTRLLYAQGSYQEMVAVGRSLARAGRAAGHARLQAMGARVEGAGLICLGRLADGTALVEATMPDPAAGTDNQAADAATLLAGAYLTMGAVDRGAALSERMLAAAEAAKDEFVAAMHTLLLAVACYLRGDWPRSRDLIGRAEQRFAAAGSSPLAVRVVTVLAPVLIGQGAWEQARAYLDGSLQAARSMRAAHPERAAQALLAELDVRQGRPQAAIARLEPLAAGDLAWDHAVMLLSALAAAYLQTGDLERAQAHADRAVGQARRLGAWAQGVRALEVLGLVHAARGHHDLARAAYQEGLQRSRAMPYPYGQARLLHACGLLDCQQHHQTAARAKFAEALAIFENLGADTDASRLRAPMAAAGPGEAQSRRRA
jgi:tetratricopeptide (TPR) repeat protein